MDNVNPEDQKSNNEEGLFDYGHQSLFRRDKRQDTQNTKERLVDQKQQNLNNQSTAPSSKNLNLRPKKRFLFLMIFPVLFPVILGFEVSRHKFITEYFISQSPEVTLDNGKKIQLEYSSPQFIYSPLFESWGCSGFYYYPCTDGTHHWHIKPELYFTSTKNIREVERIPIPWPPKQRLGGLSEIKQYSDGKSVYISEIYNDSGGDLNFKILAYNSPDEEFKNYQASIKIKRLQDGMYNNIIVPKYSEIRYLELYPELNESQDQIYYYPEKDEIFTNEDLNAASKQIKLVAHNFKTNTTYNIEEVNLSADEYRRIKTLFRNQESKAFLDKDNNQHFLLYSSKYCYANYSDCGDPIKIVFSEDGKLITRSSFTREDANFYRQLSDDLSDRTREIPLSFFGLPIDQKLLYLKELIIYNVLRPFVIWFIFYLALLRTYFKRNSTNAKLTITG